MIRQYVESAGCLACKGCCSFHSRDWAPRLLSFEKKQLGSEQLAGELLPETGMLRCSCLNKATHTCRIYPVRPWECMLYPFMLSYRNQTLDLVAHLACPSIADTAQTPDFFLYVEYLSRLFREPEIREMLLREMDLFVSYHDAEMLLVRSDVLGLHVSDAPRGTVADGTAPASS